jgi:hypothetical protein
LSPIYRYVVYPIFHAARFDLEDFDGKTGYAEYDYFYISNSTLYYKLEISGYHGNVGHGMEFHTGMYC